MKHSSFLTFILLSAFSLLAVSGCKKVVLPPGPEAFSNTNLSGALLIPDDVTEIRNGAFRGSNVSSVMFGNKFVTIGSSAFSDCNSLTGELNLPDSLCSIGDYAFSNCSFTGRLILPEGIITIPSYCFVGCSFRSVHFPHQISNYSSTHSEDDSISQLWVVSSCDSYSEKAEELAAEKNVRLIDGKEFAALLLEVGIKGLSL